MDAKGLTQAELARRVGISQPTIWKLLKGHSQSSAHLHKIARALGTTPEYLDGETDDPSEAGGGRESAISDRNANDDTIDVPMIDLAYGMGGTYLEDHTEARTEPFPLAFIRRYTKAKACLLYTSPSPRD